MGGLCVYRDDLRLILYVVVSMDAQIGNRLIDSASNIRLAEPAEPSARSTTDLML